MTCKEFEEKIFGIDDCSDAERLALKEHISQCPEDHKALAWMLEDLSFSTPLPADTEKLTTNIMQIVAASGKSNSRFLGSYFLRYAAALVVFALTATFAWELSSVSPVNYQHVQVIKSESNSAFIQRIRQKPKTASLMAEIRACRAQCINPLAEGCVACMNALNNLNNNSK